jgi:hypothetical protein
LSFIGLWTGRTIWRSWSLMLNGVPVEATFFLYERGGVRYVGEEFCGKGGRQGGPKTSDSDSKEGTGDASRADRTRKRREMLGMRLIINGISRHGQKKGLRRSSPRRVEQESIRWLWILSGLMLALTVILAALEVRHWF